MAVVCLVLGYCIVTESFDQKVAYNGLFYGFDNTDGTFEFRTGI